MQTISRWVEFTHKNSIKDSVEIRGKAKHQGLTTNQDVALMQAIVYCKQTQGANACLHQITTESQNYRLDLGKHTHIIVGRILPINNPLYKYPCQKFVFNRVFETYAYPIFKGTVCEETTFLKENVNL